MSCHVGQQQVVAIFIIVDDGLSIRFFPAAIGSPDQFAGQQMIARSTVGELVVRFCPIPVSIRVSGRHVVRVIRVRSQASTTIQQIDRFVLQTVPQIVRPVRHVARRVSQLYLVARLVVVIRLSAGENLP